MIKLIPVNSYLLDRLIWVDYTIIVLIGIYILLGMVRGGRKEMLCLISWLVAIAVAWNFAEDLSKLLPASIPPTPVKLAAAFAIMLVVTRVFTSFIIFLMSQRSNANKSSFGDHLAGILVGLCRGIVIVAIMILMGGLTTLPKDSWWRESQLIPPFEFSVIWLKDHIPTGMSGYIRFR
ncbi:MAG: CvpA family protein [Gammaproteobacteria bacterium]